MRLLSPDERAEIERLWEDGEAMIDIASAVGRRLSTVHYYLVKVGQHESLRRIDEALAKRILRLYGRGVNAKTIQEHLGISRTAYYKVVRGAGVYRPRRVVDDQEREAIIRDYKAGMTIPQIAFRHRWTEKTVYNALHAGGVELIGTHKETHPWLVWGNAKRG